MRYCWVFFCFLFFLFGCHSPDSEALHDSQGHKFSFTALKGKWVFVNYWATWCHVCMSEIPELDRFSGDYANQGIVMLGINYDLLKGAALQKAVKQASITYPVIQEDLSKHFTWGSVDVVPTTFIINPEGKVVKRLLGPQTEASLLTALAQLKNNVL